MSRQLTFSATVSTLVLALFALTAGRGVATDGSAAAAHMPLAMSAAIE